MRIGNAIRRRVRRAVTACVVVLLAPAWAGCGEDDVDRVRAQARERVEDVRGELREQRERLRRRVAEIIGRIERAIPEAEATDPSVRSRGRTDARTIDLFMTSVIKDVDDYWTTTMRESGLTEPRVRYVWIPAGRLARGACGPAGAQAAFYCPTDDTIYVANEFASALYDGVLRGLPGEPAGGHAAGDFAVAYVIAHEYAHNIQNELRLFDNRVTPAAKPFELQADCLAGSWANSAYEQGEVTRQDLAEILDTALAVGDFDVGNAQHHGTPQERRAAVLDGLRSGDPAVCSRYVPEV